jgi:hypothetical protein
MGPQAVGQVWAKKSRGKAEAARLELTTPMGLALSQNPPASTRRATQRSSNSPKPPRRQLVSFPGQGRSPSQARRSPQPVSLAYGLDGNSFQCPSETTSTVPSTTLMAV